MPLSMHYARTTQVSVQVQTLLFDPADSRRLAFHLGAPSVFCRAPGRALASDLTGPRLLSACGWSGVIDLTALAVSHVYCPPPPWLATDEVRM